MTQVVTQIAKQLYQPGISYYKIGVGLLELISSSHQQLDWLNPKPDDTRLMNTFDKINQNTVMILYF